MSKKMMKRSLALGALMAFVITGSAMAKETWEPITTPLAGLSDAGTPAYMKYVSNVDVVDLTITSGGNSIYVCGPNQNLEIPDMKINADTINLTKTSGEGAVILNSGDGTYGKIDIDFVNSMTLTANGKAHGISNVSQNGIIDIYGTGDFTLTASENGVYARVDSSQINIDAKNVTIESLGEDEGGDKIKGNAVLVNKKANVSIKATENVNLIAVEGKDAIGIHGNEGQVYNAAITVSAGNNIDIDGQVYNRQGSKVDLDAKNSVTIDTNGEDAIVSSGGTVEIDATNDIKITSLLKDGIQTEGAKGVTLNAGNVEITAGAWGVNSTGDASSSVVVKADNIVVTGTEGAIRTLGAGSGVGLEGTNSTQITGDIIASSTSIINANFNGEESFLKGAVQTAASATTSFEFNGGTWNVTGDSTVTEITGEEANIKVGMASENAIAKVEIKNDLSEDTVANVSGDGDVSDYLAANGKTAVEAFASSEVAAIDTDGVLTTEEGMTGGAYTLKITEDGVEATQADNTKSDAVSNAGMALKAHYRAHMNDMNKRMGELRFANGETGVWTRMVRGETEYEGAKMQYNQYQLGYDEKLSVDKRWIVGAAVTFSEGDANYGQGSTEDKSTAFAIYGSKLNNDGTFVDLIARYAKLESDLDDRNYGTGDYSANGMSVSAEFGKRIQQGNGLWIEPQVELTYGTVDSADVAFNKGFKAHYESMDSFIARAGFALGKDIKRGNVYARASYLYDFDGETATQFEGGKAITEDFGGGWWEVGVGANINLSKATYIYADVEKTFGGEVDTNWQWNLGVRYSF